MAFANVLADGTLNVGASSDQVADSNISHTANSGVYCFTNLPFLPSNAVVAGDNSFGNNDTLASISIDKRDPARGARRLSGRRHAPSPDPRLERRGRHDERAVQPAAGRPSLRNLDPRRPAIAAFRAARGVGL